MDDRGVADAFYTVLSIGIVLAAAIAISGVVLSTTARQGHEAGAAAMPDGGMKKGAYAFYYAASSGTGSGDAEDIVPVRLAVERVDETISFNSTTAPHGAPASDGLVIWSGYLYVPSDGDYTMELRSDGHAWLWVDGKAIGQSRETLNLTAGYHPLKAKYLYRDLKAASCSLWWGQGSIMSPVTALYR